MKRQTEGRRSTTHEMRLHPAPFAMIQSGRKTIELRLLDEKRRRIRVGDTILFRNTANEVQTLFVQVTALDTFADFAELYQHLPLLDCGYTPEDVGGASPKDMEPYYAVEEQRRYGVVGIHMRLLDPMEAALRRYFLAWLQNDIAVLPETFAEDALYSEYYGPEYHGLAQLFRWFEDWHQHGAVLRWDIKRVMTHEETVIAEWYFQCDYKGTVDGFDGVTIADFDREGQKIVKLCEFQSKAEHCYPYGE